VFRNQDIVLSAQCSALSVQNLVFSTQDVFGKQVSILAAAITTVCEDELSSQSYFSDLYFMQKRLPKRNYLRKMNWGSTWN